MRKYSKQRAEIERVVKENRIHPTADDVYAMVKKENPNISLGTVYRNLNLLAHDGIITKLSSPTGSDRFDGTTTLHYHVSCTECAKIFDVEPLLIYELNKQIKNETGVEIQTSQLVLNGICEECKIKKEEEGLRLWVI